MVTKNKKIAECKLNSYLKINMNYSNVRKKNPNKTNLINQKTSMLWAEYFFCFRNKINLGKIMEG